MQSKERIKYVEKLREFLRSQGYNTHIYHWAASGSVYLKFDFKKLGSIRIANHNGRTKYRYIFNLREDIEKRYSQRDRGIIRYYIPYDDYVSLILAIKHKMKHLRLRGKL